MIVLKRGRTAAGDRLSWKWRTEAAIDQAEFGTRT